MLSAIAGSMIRGGELMTLKAASDSVRQWASVNDETISTNCRDLNPYDIQNFPVPEAALADGNIASLSEMYLKDLERNSTMLVRQQKQTGKTQTQSFKIQKSKAIINEIDRGLAKHYAFTQEELDFIINYDIKYRMGLGAEEPED